VCRPTTATLCPYVDPLAHLRFSFSCGSRILGMKWLLCTTLRTVVRVDEREEKDCLMSNRAIASSVFLTTSYIDIIYDLARFSSESGFPCTVNSVHDAIYSGGGDASLRNPIRKVIRLGQATGCTSFLVLLDEDKGKCDIYYGG
jgi:hypothetical protein